MTAKETLIRTLFHTPQRTHRNIKFFRGTSDVISEDALCAEANRVLFQIDNSLIKCRSDLIEDFPQVDVRHMLVAG